MPETKTVMIQGVEFTVPIRYSAGHTLTENEARALNQVLHENLRNNFASKVKASKEGAEGAIPMDQLQSALDAYANDYVFSAASAGGGTSRSLDPIEREARALAKELVKDALAKKGKSMTPPKDATEEQKVAYKQQIEDKIVEVAGREQVIAQARANVAARSKALSKISADLELA